MNLDSVVSYNIDVALHGNTQPTPTYVCAVYAPFLLYDSPLRKQGIRSSRTE